MATPLGLVAKPTKVVHARLVHAAQIGPLTLSSLDAEKDKLSITLHPLGLQVVKGDRHMVIPYANVASFEPKDSLPETA